MFDSQNRILWDEGREMQEERSFHTLRVIIGNDATFHQHFLFISSAAFESSAVLGFISTKSLIYLSPVCLNGHN